MYQIYVGVIAFVLTVKTILAPEAKVNTAPCVIEAVGIGFTTTVVAAAGLLFSIVQPPTSFAVNEYIPLLRLVIQMEMEFPII